MTFSLLFQFTQNENLREQLFATKGTVLVEANPFNRIWGIGLTANNPKALNKNTWRGENRLGYILTQIRDELMKPDITGHSESADDSKK